MTARWLGVPPWELLEQPTVWLEWGQAAMNAEAGAQEEIRKRQERRSKMAQATRGR